MSRSVSAVAVASGVLGVAYCGVSSTTVETVAVSGASVTPAVVGMSCPQINVIGLGMIAKAVTFTAVSFSDF